MTKRDILIARLVAAKLAAADGKPIVHLCFSE